MWMILTKSDLRSAKAHFQPRKFCKVGCRGTFSNNNNLRPQLHAWIHTTLLTIQLSSLIWFCLKGQLSALGKRCIHQSSNYRFYKRQAENIHSGKGVCWVTPYNITIWILGSAPHVNNGYLPNLDLNFNCTDNWQMFRSRVQSQTHL